MATWSLLFLLLSVHLATNHAAVRAVVMRTLNRQRANIVFSELFNSNVILTPVEVARKETIFERGGILRWKGSKVLGHAEIGVPFQVLLEFIGEFHSHTRSVLNPIIKVRELEELFEMEQYILWYDESSKKVVIVLKGPCSATSQLKSWAHGLLIAAHAMVKTPLSKSADERLQEEQTTMSVLRETLDFLNTNFNEYVQRLADAGWDLQATALETQAGFRVFQQTS